MRGTLVALPCSTAARSPGPNEIRVADELLEVLRGEITCLAEQCLQLLLRRLAFGWEEDPDRLIEEAGDPLQIFDLGLVGGAFPARNRVRGDVQLGCQA